MKHDDLISIWTVGVGLYKLSVFGDSPSRGHVEVMMDEDDVDDLLEDLRRARRAKVTITAG